MVKNLPANAGDIRDTGSILGQEDPPEKGMATHSSILAGRIPWTEEPGGLQSMGSQRVRHNWVTNTFTQLSLGSWYRKLNSLTKGHKITKYNNRLGFKTGVWSAPFWGPFNLYS